MKLTFAIDHVTRGGRPYKAGSTHDVNDHDARPLLIEGIARRASDAPAVPVGAESNKKEAPRG